MDAALLAKIWRSNRPKFMKPLIISLTAIPPRFPYLHETLNSLLQQNADIAAINLYLPRHYRRFDWDCSQLPTVPKGIQIQLIDNDLGPASKVLPAVKEYQGQDVNILFCDDDKVYDPDWARRFSDASLQHPDCCIVEEGGDVCDYSSHAYRGERQPRSERRIKNMVYRFNRLVSLGLWKPRKNTKSGHVDVLEGWGGVLVRPSFFTPAAFDIPDILWMVDDIWLSGQLALNDVPIWLNGEDSLRTRGNSNEVKSASLRKFVHEGHGRTEANQACVDYFRDQHGIWL
jgi:hypothetical protein